MLTQCSGSELYLYYNLFNKDFLRPTLDSAYRVIPSLFSGAPGQGGKARLSTVYEKKMGDLPQPSSRRFSENQRYGVTTGSAGWAGTCFLGAIFAFVRNIVAFKASETFLSLLLKSNVTHLTHPFLIIVVCGWQGEIGGFSEGDLQNKESRLSVLWLPQTTWWQDNNKGGRMLTISGFAYTLATDCLPQPNTIPQ